MQWLCLTKLFWKSTAVSKLFIQNPWIWIVCCYLYIQFLSTQTRTTDTRSRPKFKSQSQIHKYLGCGYEGLLFCRNNGWIMQNMDKGLTKWMLIIWPKIPQMPQNLSAQFFCPSPKVLDFNKKRLHWASVVCGSRYEIRNRCDGSCRPFFSKELKHLHWRYEDPKNFRFWTL